MQITIGDLGVIYTCLLGITAVVLVLANWRIESRRKREEEGGQ